MSATDPLAQILIHVGESRKGIENLEKGQRDLEGGLSDVNRHLSRLNSSAVRQTECTAFRDSIRDALDQTAAENTTQHAQILTDMQTAIPATTTSGLNHWLNVASKLIPVLLFIGSMLWGVVTIGRNLERFRLTAEADKRRQQTMTQAIKKLAAQKTKIIYVRQQPVTQQAPKSSPKRRAPYRRRRAVP